jgi:hypothetical protein
MQQRLSSRLEVYTEYQLESERGKGDSVMSASGNSEKWLDRWWPLFLILFGVACVGVLVTFAPVI